MGMPRVIANGGLATGTVFFLLIGVLNAYCNITMVKCAKILERRTGKTWFQYEEVVEASFSSFAPTKDWQTAAKWARRIALWMLILCQLGLLSFYYQIIATTVQKELQNSVPSLDVPLVAVELVVCVCVLPYSWVRNLRLLAAFSTVANIFKFISVVIVLQYACSHLKPIDSIQLVPYDLWTIPLFVGGTVFTVEGIAMILPIENRARNPDDYTGSCGIVAMATATNIAMNLLMGIFGYLAIGDGVTGNILVSLPHQFLYRLVSLFYAGMVFLTFTLQLYQPAEAIYDWLKSRHRNDLVLTFGNIAVRSGLTVVTFMFAALIPRAELMMSLVGAVNACILVFILPVISELLLLHGEPEGVTKVTWVKNTSIVLFGALAFVTGTYTSLRDIMRAI